MNSTTVVRFTKKGHPNNFGLVKFVIKARSKDDVYFKLKYIKAEGGVIYASDGHRLHSANVEWCEDGIYEVVKDSASEIILISTDIKDYPDIKKVTEAVANNTTKVDLCLDLSADVARINRAMITTEAINIGFVKDICGLMSFARLDPEGNKPILFLGEEGIAAYIMPLRDSRGE